MSLALDGEAGGPELGRECNWKAKAKGLGEHRRDVTLDAGTLDETMGQSFASSLPTLERGHLAWPRLNALMVFM